MAEGIPACRRAGLPSPAEKSTYAIQRWNVPLTSRLATRFRAARMPPSTATKDGRRYARRRCDISGGAAAALTVTQYGVRAVPRSQRVKGGRCMKGFQACSNGGALRARNRPHSGTSSQRPDFNPNSETEIGARGWEKRLFNPSAPPTLLKTILTRFGFLLSCASSGWGFGRVMPPSFTSPRR